LKIIQSTIGNKDETKKNGWQKCREVGELHLDGHQSPIQFFALVNLPDEEISVSPVDFRVSDVNHVLVDVKVHLQISKQ
jgi:hypothetical protein